MVFLPKRDKLFINCPTEFQFNDKKNGTNAKLSMFQVAPQKEEEEDGKTHTIYVRRRQWNASRTIYQNNNKNKI